MFIEGYFGRECGREILSQRRDSKSNIEKLNKVGNVFKGNGQAGNVYSPNGISPTISANGGGAGGKTGLYLVPGDKQR